MRSPFMGLVSSQIVDRISVRPGCPAGPDAAGGHGLGGLLIATERAGAGNVLPYACCRPYAVFILLLMGGAAPSRYTRASDLYFIFGVRARQAAGALRRLGPGAQPRRQRPHAQAPRAAARACRLLHADAPHAGSGAPTPAVTAMGARAQRSDGRARRCGAAARHRAARRLPDAGTVDADAGGLPDRRRRIFRAGPATRHRAPRLPVLFRDQPGCGDRWPELILTVFSRHDASHGRGRRAHRRRHAGLGDPSSTVDQRRSGRAPDRPAGPARADAKLAPGAGSQDAARCADFFALVRQGDRRQSKFPAAVYVHGSNNTVRGRRRKRRSCALHGAAGGAVADVASAGSLLRYLTDVYNAAPASSPSRG